jgi:hypothetical protein
MVLFLLEKNVLYLTGTEVAAHAAGEFETGSKRR